MSFPGGGERRLGARVTANYQKNIPGGKLLADYSRLLERRHQLSQIRELPVFQEKHTVRIGLPIRLDRPGLVPGSLQLRGESGTPFLEGFDYAVRFFGNTAEIEILPPSRIRDGQTGPCPEPPGPAEEKIVPWNPSMGVDCELLGAKKEIPVDAQ